jgi:hypothetical protein
MVIGCCSVFVYIHMYVCGYEPRQANAVLRQSKKDGERGRAACFINSPAYSGLALNFLLLFGGSCGERFSRPLRKRTWRRAWPRPQLVSPVNSTDVSNISHWASLAAC